MGRTMNFLFVDAHAEALDPTTVYVKTNMLWRALPN